jgi:hypothetical protein
MNKHQIIRNPKTDVPYIDTDNAIVGYSKSEIAKSENNDCCVRAFASVTESSYDEAHDYVKKTFNRHNNQGTPRFPLTMSEREGLKTLNGYRYKELKNHDKTTYKKPMRYYCREDFKYKYRYVECILDSRRCPLITTYGKTRASQMTVGTFLKEYNVGRYLIHVRGHAFTIIDGVVVGNPLDSKQIKCRIVGAYKFYK